MGICTSEARTSRLLATTGNLKYSYRSPDKAAPLAGSPIQIQSLVTTNGDYDEHPSGDSVEIYVLLYGNAPPGGVQVALTSTSTVLPVPSSLTVPSGSSLASFVAVSKPVTSDARVTITGTYNGTASRTLTFTNNQVATFTASPNKIYGGLLLPCNVTLSAPSGQWGTEVNIEIPHDHSALSAVVTVPPGASSLSFGSPTPGFRTDTTVLINVSVGSTDRKTASANLLATQFDSVASSAPSVVGGKALIGSLNFLGAVPSGGYAIQLSSSDPAVQMVPVVDTPEGKTAVTFRIVASAVQTSRQVTISATLGSTTKTCTVTVLAPGLTSITPWPSSVWGGEAEMGTVNISSAAPAGGISIPLTSNTSYATVPAAVLVPEGLTTANFVISTTVVPTTTLATISGTLGSTLSGTLTINAPSVAKVWFPGPTLSGGNSTNGAVSLNGPRIGVDTTITLASSSSLLILPASVIVPAGSLRANFLATSKSVSAPTPVTITATYSGTATTPLTINPFTIKNISLSPAKCYGSAKTALTLNLSDTPQQATTFSVGLSSSNPLIQVPATVSISGNSSISIVVPAVSADQTTNLTATLNGSSTSAQLTDCAPQIDSVVGPKPSPVAGGLSYQAAIHILGTAPSGGLRIALASNTPDASVPASATMPAGSSAMSVTIKTKTVITTVPVTITATIPSGSLSCSFELAPPSLSTLTVSPSSVKGGASVVGKLTLSGPAPAGGCKVLLGCSSSAATVKAYIVVPQNATSASFAVKTIKVSSTTNVSVTATLGVIKTATLTLTH